MSDKKANNKFVYFAIIIFIIYFFYTTNTSPNLNENSDNKKSPKKNVNKPLHNPKTVKEEVIKPVVKVKEIDLATQRQELISKCKLDFKAPEIGSKIKLTFISGVSQEVTLLELTSFNIKFDTSRSVISYSKDMLSKESRILCFASDYAEDRADKIMHGENGQNELSVNTPPESPTGQYHVLDVRKINDMPDQTGIRIDAVVSEPFTENYLKELLNKLYIEAKSIKKFKNNNGLPTHFFIVLYNAKKNIPNERGADLPIATFIKKGEDSNAIIKIDHDKINAFKAEPKIIFGFSQEKREEIYYETVKCEDRAYSEAAEKYPLPKYGLGEDGKKKLETQTLFCRELIKKYKNELCSKYKINMEQLDKIGLEGSSKNWLIPLLPNN